MTEPGVPFDASGDDWRAAWASDRIAWMTAVVRAHRRLVVEVARRSCGEDRAADVAQEVFLRLWTHPDRFDPARGSLESYLAMMAKGIAVDIARGEERRRRRDERAALPAVSDASDRLPLDDVVVRRIGAAIGDLDPHQREVVVEAYVEELRRGEIAQRHGIAEGTVKSRIRLGLHRLRRQLGDLQEPSSASDATPQASGGAS